MGTPSTFQAVVIACMLLLPGAIYVWAFEQQNGPWGVDFSDRVTRFIGFSTFFQSIFAWPEYYAYHHWVSLGNLSRGTPLPLTVWIAIPIYFLIPAAAGRLVGGATRKNRGWARVIAGRAPAPRAWDHVFSSGIAGWIVIHPKNGDPPIMGTYARDDTTHPIASYAAGTSSAADLFLNDMVPYNPATGGFAENPDGTPKFLGRGMLIRWDEISYLEFIPDLDRDSKLIVNPGSVVKSDSRR